MNVYTDDELERFGEGLGRYRSVTAPRELRTQLRRAVLTRELPTRKPFLTRFAPALGAAVVVVALATGSGVAAAASLPGDPAFGLKTAVEQVQLAFAPDNASRLRVLVEQSERRLDELQAAVDRRPDAIPAATRAYAEAAARLNAEVTVVSNDPASSARDEALALASAMSEKHEQVLTSLLDRLPDQAKPAIQKAIETQQDTKSKTKDIPTPSAGPTPSEGTSPSGRPATPSHPVPSQKR